MFKTVEAILQLNGALEFLEPIHFATAQRVLITFTGSQDESLSGAKLSERSLSTDWLRDAEDSAWAHLQMAAVLQVQ